MTDTSDAQRFISGPCGICCGVGRHSDGRWCETCGKTGTAHIMLPVRPEKRLREAEAHLWALLVWFGSEHDNPYIHRDLQAAADYVDRYVASEDMPARHREAIRVAKSRKGAVRGESPATTGRHCDMTSRRRTPRALFWEMQGYYSASRRYHKAGRIQSLWMTLLHGWKD